MSRFDEIASEFADCMKALKPAAVRNDLKNIAKEVPDQLKMQEKYQHGLDKYAGKPLAQLKAYKEGC